MTALPVPAPPPREPAAELGRSVPPGLISTSPFLGSGSVGSTFSLLQKMSSDSQGVRPFLGGISVAVFGLGVSGDGIGCLFRGGG